MSFKNPIKADQLPKVDAKSYLRMLAVLLTKKFLNGNSVEFTLVLNHVYKDLDDKKSERVPLLLIGDNDSSWKDFHKKDLGQGETQKKNMVSGMVRKNGDELVFDIDGSRGLSKIPSKSIQYLEAMLKKISPNFSVSTTGGSAGTLDEELQASKVATVIAETKNSEKTITKDLKNTNESTVYKTEKKAEAKEAKEEAKGLSDAITALKKQINASTKSVSANIKKGTTSAKDIEAVKSTNTAYDEFMALYEKASEPVRKKFAPAHSKLTSQKKQLIKLSLAAKQTKTTVAQRMADTHYQNLEKRKATEEEVQKFQTAIKSAIDFNKASTTKLAQDFLLRAVAFIIKNIGVDKFDVKYIQQVMQKSAK